MARDINRRYQTADNIETQFEPGSRNRVMRNKLGIISIREIDRLEYEAFLKAQTHYDSIIMPDTRFTAAMLCQMHGDWLGGIYEWAGRYRTVGLSKGSFSWPPPQRVADNMMNFEKGLLRKNTPCPMGSIEETASRIAKVHADFLLIHPFRDGNGRLSRWLADMMAVQAGHVPAMYNFTGDGGEKCFREYVRAVQKGYELDYSVLTEFFRAALVRGLEEEEKI